MAALELILIIVLQFYAGISGGPSFYHRPGDAAILPCDSVSSPSDTTCSSVTWLYNRELSQTITEVRNGNVMKSSVRAARLSLDSNCSLLISSISAEDAGLYTCRQRETKTSLYLHVLTISRYLPEADLTGDGEVILRCFLLKYSELLPCAENSLRWVDETGAELQGKGVGYEIIAQKNCASFLTYKHQRGHTRRDTCRFVEESIVKIQADYTPVLTKPDSAWSPLSYVMLSLRLAALLLTTLVVFLLLRDRGNMASLAVNSVKNEGDEVKYENVDAASSLH